MPRVTITIPEKTPQPYRFDLLREIVTLGRGLDNDIVVGCGSVSGKHAEMRRVKGGYEIVDVGSTNGLKVDGVRQQTVVLKTGMTVKMGDVEFGFTLTEEELAVLDTEAESITKQAEKDEADSLGKEPSEKIFSKDKQIDSKKSKDDEDDKDEDDEDDEEDDDGPEKLPPVRLDKRKEKEDQEAEKRKKAERKEREKREAKAKAEREEGKRDRPSKSKDGDEFAESKAVSIGSGFILFTLIAAAAAFFYGAQTRHEKDTGESLLKGIVNKEDAKNDAPTEVEEKPENGAE